MAQISARRVVRTSFIVDITDVILNIIVAVASGSAVMLVQALQGVADLLTSGLLLIGVKRSRRSSDKRHPFGYGREIYFWTLMASLIMLTVTATASFYHGWQHFFFPQPLEYAGFSLLVLVVGLVTNSYALGLSYKRLRQSSGASSLWELFNSSVLVETKTTFVLDLMGVMSAVFGFLALLLYVVTDNPQYDGVGAMVIGVGIAFMALLIVFDVKDLLVGRSVEPEVEKDIRETALAVKGVEGVLDLRTMYLGSERLLVNMELDIANDLHTGQIEKLMDIIKAEVKDKVPTIHHMQIEVETPHRTHSYSKKF